MRPIGGHAAFATSTDPIDRLLAAFFAGRSPHTVDAYGRDLDRFTYQTPDSFFRWLASIAGHVIIDRARYHGRERRGGPYLWG